MNKNLFWGVLVAASTAAALPAVAQTAQEKGQSAPTASSATPNDAKTINELQQAAQRLREAVQTMAQAPAGDQRNQAIRAGNDALLSVHRAMANLPPNLLTAGADETQYKKAMDLLQQSAQRLREAAQALAQQPAGERRNEAIKQINDSLLETQQVMISVVMAQQAK